MAIIWGLDLREIQWGKFKNSYMWNNEYHMRRTKFIIYQLAMILCVVSESLGTAALSGGCSNLEMFGSRTYTDHIQITSTSKTSLRSKTLLRMYTITTTLASHPIVREFTPTTRMDTKISADIFVGVFVATIFGAAFFFDLFWPERYESPSVKIAWKACAVFACMLALADALAYTDIVATRSAYVTGTNAAETQMLLAEYGGSPLAYRHNGRAIASVVFLWPGMIFTVVRSVLFPSPQILETTC
jgi:hypothetical protein